MRKLEITFASLLSLALAACGSSSKTETPPYNGFVQPAGTVAVTFAVDDTANKVFTAGNLQWKGSMTYDSVTRMLTCKSNPLKSACPDSSWGGPWADLYDDGPYTSAVTSHEGPTQTAGDHIWSVTVFVTPPAAGSPTDTYEYGLNDSSLTPCNPVSSTCRLAATNGWIWVGGNGTFTVAPGDTAAKTAPGITFAKFGTNDVRFIIDKNALAAGFCSTATSQVCATNTDCPSGETCNTVTWDTTKITVKGSAWGWNEFLLLDDGTLGDVAAADSLYTFQLGQYTGAGNYLPHFGLLNAGVKPEFVFVFNGKEYKDGGGKCANAGVTAFTMAAGGAWTSAAISLAANGNTYITVP